MACNGYEKVWDLSPSELVQLEGARGTKLRVTCGVLTARSGRCRCWPIGEPSGPAKVPVWMLETRISPSSLRHAGWSASMRRRRTPGSSS